jgi:cytochrome P450
MDIHYDPEYWKNPDVFDPSRFYDAKTDAFVPNERLIPFLIGKRFCLGKTLAEKEYFLFFTGLMQKFEFVPVTGSELPGIDRKSGVQIGTVRCCPVYDVILKRRSAK